MCERRVLIAAVVTDIHDSTVAYPSCTGCYSKLLVDPTTGRFHCVRCGTSCHKSKVQWRYRLVLSLADGTSIGTVVVFGKTLDDFFGKSATDFTRSLDDLEKTGYPASSMLSEALIRTFHGKYFYFAFKVSSPNSIEETPTLKNVLKSDSSLAHSQLERTLNFESSHTLAYQMLSCSDGVYASVTDHMRVLVKQLRNKNQSAETRTPSCNQSKSFRCQAGNQSKANIKETGSVNIDQNSRLRSKNSLSSCKTLSFGEDQESVRFSFEDSCDQSRPSANSNRYMISNSHLSLATPGEDSGSESVKSMSKSSAKPHFKSDFYSITKEQFLSASELESKKLSDCVTFDTFTESEMSCFHPIESLNKQTLEKHALRSCNTISLMPYSFGNSFSHLSVTNKLDFDNFHDSFLSITSKRIDDELKRRETVTVEKHEPCTSKQSSVTECYSDTCKLKEVRENGQRLAEIAVNGMNAFKDDMSESDILGRIPNTSTYWPKVENENLEIVPGPNKIAQEKCNGIINEIHMPESEDLNAFFESQFDGIEFTQDVATGTSGIFDVYQDKLASEVLDKNKGLSNDEKFKEEATIDNPGTEEVKNCNNWIKNSVADVKIKNTETDFDGVGNDFLYLPDSEDLEDFLDSFECPEESNVEVRVDSIVSIKFSDDKDKTPDKDVEKNKGEEKNEEVKTVKCCGEDEKIKTQGNSETFRVAENNLDIVIESEQEFDSKENDLDKFKQCFADISKCKSQEIKSITLDAKPLPESKDVSVEIDDIAKYEVDFHISVGQVKEEEDSDIRQFYHELSQVSLDEVKTSTNLSKSTENCYNSLLSCQSENIMDDEIESMLHERTNPCQNLNDGTVVDKTPDLKDSKSVKNMGKSTINVMSISGNKLGKRSHSCTLRKSELKTESADCVGEKAELSSEIVAHDVHYLNNAVNSSSLTENTCSRMETPENTALCEFPKLELNSVNCSADLFEASWIEKEQYSDNILTVCTPSFHTDTYLENSRLDENIVEDSPLGTSTPGLDNCILFDSYDLDIEFQKSVIKDDCKRSVKFDRCLRRVSSCHIIDIRMKLNESPLIGMPRVALKSCLKLPRGMFSSKDVDCSKLSEEIKYKQKGNEKKVILDNPYCTNSTRDVTSDGVRCNMDNLSLDGSADLFGESITHTLDQIIISTDSMRGHGGKHTYLTMNDVEKGPENDNQEQKAKSSVSDTDGLWLNESSDSLVAEVFSDDNMQNEDEKDGENSNGSKQTIEINSNKNVKNEVNIPKSKPETPDLFASQDIFDPPLVHEKFRKNSRLESTELAENINVNQENCRDLNKIRKRDKRQALKMLVINTPDCDTDLHLEERNSLLNSVYQSTKLAMNSGNHQASIEMKANISVTGSPDIFGDSMDELYRELNCDSNNFVSKSGVLCKKLFF